MKNTMVTIAVFVTAFFFASGALGAGYLKYEGIDGESKSAEDRPTEEVAFYYNKIAFAKMTARVGGPLVIKDENGKTTVLKRDGRYRLSTGGHVWVKNGRVVKNTGHELGHSLGKAPDKEDAGLLLPAVQKVRESGRKSGSGSNLEQLGPSTQPEPSSPQSVKSGETAEPTGLLLPAVQKVRSSAGKSESDSKGKKGGNVEYEWKVEEGTK